MADDTRPTTETEKPDLSTENQKPGDARRPNDTLGKEQESEETVPRKSSLTGED